MRIVGAKTPPAVVVVAEICWQIKRREGQYHDGTRTVQLRQDWRNRKLSHVVLVHELRHHWQTETGQRMTLDERECDAYTFTSEWAKKATFFEQSLDQAGAGQPYCDRALKARSKS